MKILCFLGFHRWKKIESESYGTHAVIMRCPRCQSEICFEYTDAGAQTISGKISWIKPRTAKQFSALRKYFKSILKKHKVFDKAGLPKRDKNGFSYSLGNRKQRRLTARNYNRYKRSIKNV
ncbi:MAG: hypothetical protein MJ197_07780 [Bacteroidales bacterium]|nr:hypothetical protein [Bacteroidales bacterium]